MKGLFVTATGTDVGKTLVATGIVRRLRSTGYDVVPMKPVQTGCRRSGDTLLSPDLAMVIENSGWAPMPEELDDLCPFAYEPACSPHLAGRLAGRPVCLESILQSALRLSARHDFVVVEGAGGILVPLNQRETMLDLMVAMGLAVLVVARSGLGTINETLLSLRCLDSAGLRCIGVVLNDRHNDGPSFITEDNPDAIARFGGVPILGRIPYIAHLPPERIAAEQKNGYLSDQLWERFDNALSSESVLELAQHRGRSVSDIISDQTSIHSKGTD